MCCIAIKHYVRLAHSAYDCMHACIMMVISHCNVALAPDILYTQPLVQRFSTQATCVTRVWLCVVYIYLVLRIYTKTIN